MNESDMLQWLEELVEIPPEEDAALNELPDSFIWRHPLTRMTALTDPSSLGLPAFRGAVFAGPAGNGKHTLARALLATLWRSRYIERDQVSLFWLTPDQLPEGLDAAGSAELMGKLFEEVSTPDEDVRFGVIVLDRPEHYPHAQILMSRVAREVADLEGQNAVICITEDESVMREFLSCFPLIFRAFPVFHLSVIRYADHKKRPFFIQRQADETHHLLPQTTLLVYCTSLLHKCP